VKSKISTFTDLTLYDWTQCVCVCVCVCSCVHLCVMPGWMNSAQFVPCVMRFIF